MTALQAGQGCFWWVGQWARTKREKLLSLKSRSRYKEYDLEAPGDGQHLETTSLKASTWQEGGGDTIWNPNLGKTLQVQADTNQYRGIQGVKSPLLISRQALKAQCSRLAVHSEEPFRVGLWV